MNPRAVAFISQAEACKLRAYLDGGGRPTIGWGHTAGVQLGDTCTPEQASAWLSEDMAHAEARVVALLRGPTTPTLNENQMAALISFTYNLGEGSFASSTLLHFIKTGHLADAACEFEKWDHVHGRFDQGVLNRRKAERALFETPC